MDRSDYRLELDGLTLRWATDEDRGIILVGALAFAGQEGSERVSGMRETERHTLESYWNRADWAIAVDTGDAAPIPDQYTPPEGQTGDLDYVEAQRTAYRQAKEKVVAVVSLGQQRWHLGRADMTLGRISIVATRPAYRGRKGLMRALFAMVHARSEARGDAFGLVTGIVNYYRSHGYVQALHYGTGFRTQMAAISAPEDSTDWGMRLAEPSDLDVLVRLHELPRAQSEHWIAAMDITSHIRSTIDGPAAEPLFVLSHGGTVVAAVLCHLDRLQNEVVVTRVIVDPAHDLGKLTAALVPRLVQALKGYWSQHRQDAPPRSICWSLARQSVFPRHLVARELATSIPESTMTGSVELWSVRIPSFAQFLRKIQPELDARLDRNRHVLGHGYSQEITIQSFETRNAAILVIRDCKIAEIRDERLPTPTLRKDIKGILAPYEEIVKILFGRNSWRTARETAGEVQVQPAAAVALECLFPVTSVSIPAYFG